MSKEINDQPSEVEPSTSAFKARLKSRQRIIGFGAVAAIVVALGSYFGSQFIVAVVFSFWALINGEDIEQFFDKVTSSTGLQFILILLIQAFTLLIIWLFLRLRKKSFRDVGLARRPKLKDIWPAVWVCLVYFVVLIVSMSFITALIPGLDTEQKQDIGFENAQTNLQLLMVFVSLAILPPIVEEIVVRGFLYTGLKKNFKKYTAAIIASLLFAVAHLQIGNGQPLLWTAAIDTMILSMFLIYLREITGALWSGMLVHAFKNSLAFFVLFVI